MAKGRHFIVGTGGHATVVLDAWSQGIDHGAAEELILLDQFAERNGDFLLERPILAPFDPKIVAQGLFHLAIGDNLVRRRLYDELVSAGGRPFSICHPRGIVSHHALIASGVFVAANAIIAPRAQVSTGTIVNHGAVVDHDCIVGAFCHIAPTASLGGNVHLGASVLVGAGANILPGVVVGEGARIGAGAVVTRDVAPHVTISGIPAAQRG